MSTFKGGCHCGAVRYEAQGEPQISIHCYCRQCQHLTGAGHASSFALSPAAVTLSGKLSYYTLTADGSNLVDSGFCTTCGSPILKKSSGYPDMVFFHAASLDDPAQFKPQKVVYTATAQPWDLIDPALEQLN